MTQPFDDIRAILADLPAPQGPAQSAAPAPGRLADLQSWLADWRGRPAVNRPIVALYAGSSGRDPDGVRGQLEAIAAGGAPAALLAQATGAGLEAFDLAIDRPIGDMTIGAAMSERECAATMAFGMEALAKQPDLLMPAVLTDDDGAAAQALSLALFGGEATGPGITDAVARARSEAGEDPLQLLRQLGSRQIAAAAGAILAARTQGAPVLLDGYAVCAAAAVLRAVNPDALAHCRAAHVGGLAHRRLLQRLELEPIVDLDLPQDGGLGALVALQVVKAAAAL
jgi:nicotinate-nucleotide--dimethylbenzimidazole phosphoribosyltransferase